MQNRTDRDCARPALERVFRIAPTPEDALSLSGEGRDLLLDVIRPCGLQNRRLRAILEATEDYVAGRTPLTGMRWCGRYAADSWRIFVLGERPDPAEVSDKELGLFLAEEETQNSEEWRREDD
jgi:hypothetical protein